MKAILLMLSICCLYSCASISPGELWLDDNGKHINAHGGGILFHDGEYFWFGEHKTSGPEGNTAQVGVHCYSSGNLYDWRDRGIVLEVNDMPGSELERGCILERPKVVYNDKTGKFVMWFHLELKGCGYRSALAGVAVADSVAGPYTFLHALRPNKGKYPEGMDPELIGRKPAGFSGFDGGSLPAHPDSLNIIGRDYASGQMSRDMNLFVDDDSAAYLIYSSEENSTLHISRLSDDYTTTGEEYVRVFPGRFMEAPAMFKRGGKYYLMMSGCTGWKPNEARSAVADSIFGEWRELGNPCVGEGAETTFDSQSTFILNVPGTDKYIYMGDRWCPDNPIDGRYIWLPVQFMDGRFIIEWQTRWRY